MSTVLRRLRASARPALRLFAAACLLVPSVKATAVSYCEWTYYSDATYTTIVGERIRTCQGQLYAWGVVTSFRYGGCEPCGGALASAQPAAPSAREAALAETRESACPQPVSLVVPAR